MVMPDRGWRPVNDMARGLGEEGMRWCEYSA